MMALNIDVSGQLPLFSSSGSRLQARYMREYLSRVLTFSIDMHFPDYLRRTDRAYAVTFQCKNI